MTRKTSQETEKTHFKEGGYQSGHSEIQMRTCVSVTLSEIYLGPVLFLLMGMIYKSSIKSYISSVDLINQRSITTVLSDRKKGRKEERKKHGRYVELQLFNSTIEIIYIILLLL